MPYNIYNLVNENTGGEIITYDAGPSLQLTNFGTGVGLNMPSGATTLLNVIGTPVAAAAGTIAPVARFLSAATGGNALVIGRDVVTSSPTVPLVFIGPLSSASAPVFEFGRSAFVSVTSIGADAVGAVRVKFGTTLGWMPIYANAALTGTGAF